MLDCRALDHEVKAVAVWASGRVRSHLRSAAREAVGHEWAVTAVHRDRLDYGRAPARLRTASELRAELDAMAGEYQAKPIADAVKIDGRIARMVDAAWWSRSIRRELLRENETQERIAGTVKKDGQVYVSDHAAKMARIRAKANQRTLEGLEVVAEGGEALNLWEVSQASVSNPALRRAELMTRCKGFEDAAEFMGHKGLFLTMTCPKRFHRVDHRGNAVTKWDGSTPRDAQQYLCKVWARIRAAWKKAGVMVYGFRVAEPHQDGTPHWHLLLFCAPEFVRVMLSIAARHALAADRHESGAWKHRFTVKRIDPSQGSATGYIAKYIAKNIDGQKEGGGGIGDDDESALPAEVAARRVRVWASTWGIRQFQQIGGPSVTVWRELRRLGEDADPLQLELFEKPRAAANRGAWFDFWMVQGGPDVARSDLTVKPYYVADSLGKYGDESEKIKGVKGVEAGELVTEVTRLKVWTVQCAGLQATNEKQSRWSRDVVFSQAYEDAEFKRIGEAERTRTGVNNCSEDAPENEQDGSDNDGFLAYMASLKAGKEPGTEPLRV